MISRYLSCGIKYTFLWDLLTTPLAVYIILINIYDYDLNDFMIWPKMQQSRSAILP